MLQLVQQLVRSLDSHACLASSGRFELKYSPSRCDRHSQTCQRHFFEGFLPGLHDSGQGNVAWLIETQVAADDGRQLDGDGFNPTIRFATAAGPAVVLDQFELGDKRSLPYAEQGGQHLANLVRVVINGLLAHQDEGRLLTAIDSREDFSNGQRVEALGGFDQQRTVSTHSQPNSKLLYAFVTAHSSHHDLDDAELLFNPQRLLKRNGIKWIHGELHAVQIYG